MSHMNSTGDESACTDELKVYKDEGEEEEQKKSSENLTEDKVGLVIEGEGHTPFDFNFIEHGASLFKVPHGAPAGSPHAKKSALSVDGLINNSASATAAAASASNAYAAGLHAAAAAAIGLGQLADLSAVYRQATTATDQMEKTASRMYGGLLPPGIIGSFGGFMGTPPPSAPSNFYDLSALQHHHHQQQQQQQRLLHQQQRPSSTSATSTSSTSGSSVTPTTSAAASGGIGSTGGGNPAVDALSPCSTSSTSALHSELFNAATGFYGMAAYGQPMTSHFGVGPTSPYAAPAAGRHFAAAAAAAAAVLGSCFYPTRSPPDASTVFPAPPPPPPPPQVVPQSSAAPPNNAPSSASPVAQHSSTSSASAVAASASAAASAAAAAAAWLSSPLAAVAAASSPSFTPSIFNHVPPHNRQAAAVHFLSSLTAAAAASSAASSSSASSPLQPPSVSVGANPSGPSVGGAPPVSPFANAAAFHHSLAVATNGGSDKTDVGAGSPHATALSLFALSPASPAAAAVAAYCQSKTGMQFGSSMLNAGDAHTAGSPLTYTQLQPASQQHQQKDTIGGDYGADSRTSRYLTDSGSSKRSANNRSASSLSGAGVGDKHSPSRKLMRIGSVGSGGSPLSSAAASSSLDQCCSPGSPQTITGPGGSPSKTTPSTSASASSPGLTINAATLAQYRREITTENSGTGVPTKRVHIKKPLNAFMLFMKEMRPKIQEECTLKESAAINQILGKKWHELSKPEQSKYYELARKEKEIHRQLFPGWSARDNYAIHSKRKRKRKLAAAVAAASAMNAGATVGDGGLGRRDLFDSDGYFGGSGNGGNGSGGSLNSSSSAVALAAAAAAAAAAGVDLGNPKKCRARFGLEQQTRWCKPCRRKKKCVRFLTDAEYDEALKAGKLQSEPSSPQQHQSQQQQNTNKTGAKDQWIPEANVNKSNPKSPNAATFLSPTPSTANTGFGDTVSQPGSTHTNDFVRTTEEYTATTSVGGPFAYSHFSPYADFQRPAIAHSTLSFLEQQTRTSLAFGTPVSLSTTVNSTPVTVGGNSTVHEEEDDDMKNETLCVFATEASPAGSCHHDNGGDDDDDMEGDNFPHIKQEPSPLNGMFPVVTAVANAVAAVVGNSKGTEPIPPPVTSNIVIATTSSTDVTSTTTTTTPSEKRPIIFSAAALSRCEEPLAGTTAVETGTTAS